MTGGWFIIVIPTLPIFEHVDLQHNYNFTRVYGSYNRSERWDDKPTSCGYNHKKVNILSNLAESVSLQIVPKNAPILVQIVRHVNTNSRSILQRESPRLPSWIRVCICMYV